ncbi:MAG: hypothetical protein M1818_007769 [Claussenomyces sp. TS43310]|nr:MAG: hypothetical protein M1818_007769 [Claussenomyces sp. TS43310]
MVKADFSRDYYADLELQPGASEIEIKKQFKKLALKYHPDRNPGRESEVNSKFQTIQSAHEILIDAGEKARYDAGRVLRANRGSAYGAYSSTAPRASGMRGNPWSGAGSEWAPPPRPPTARKPPPPPPPPPSAGAQRYAGFQTPNAGTSKHAQEDAEARRKMYQGWESMKGQKPAKPYPAPKPIPKDTMPQSGREESNNIRHPPPRSTRPGFEDFRATETPTRKRTGFMPATPGGDEPPASNTSAYYTQRSGRPAPPSRPPRVAADPLRQFRPQNEPQVGPRLSTPYSTHGGEKTNPFESVYRSRSQRATENPENAELGENGSLNSGVPYDNHRSTSPLRTKARSRSPVDNAGGNSGSDVNSDSPPRRTFSQSNRAAQGRAGFSKGDRQHKPPTVDLDTSSDSDDFPQDGHQAFGTRPGIYAKRRSARTAASGSTPLEQKPVWPDMKGVDEPSKPTPADSRKFGASAKAAEYEKDMLNNTGLDESGYTGKDGTTEGPSMYEHPKISRKNKFQSFHQAAALPTVLEEPASKRGRRPHPDFKFPDENASTGQFDDSRLDNSPLQADSFSFAAPSGATVYQIPKALNAFEMTQFDLLNKLINRSAGSSSGAPREHSSFDGSPLQHFQDFITDEARRILRENVSGDVSPTFTSGLPAWVIRPLKAAVSSDDSGSAEKRQCLDDFPSSSIASDCHYGLPQCPVLTQGYRSQIANKNSMSSFSFNSKDEPARAPHRLYSHSAEDISTSFAPEDWHGKFQAGDFGSASASVASRARSASRTRPKSPIKKRPVNLPQASTSTSTLNSTSNSDPDPDILNQNAETLSPGDTKFSAEEWAQTFKPQTFAPPPFTPLATQGRTAPFQRASSRRAKPGSSTKAGYANRTAGTAALVDDDDSSDDKPLYKDPQTSNTTGTAEHAEISADSPNAMDIDPPMEPLRRKQSTPHMNSANDARKVPLEPSRPEWRAGNANGGGVEPAPPIKQSKSEFVNPSKSGTHSTEATDGEDFKVNFEDLKNIKPLHNPATGLDSFNDLTSDLPFPSRAAASLPISRSFSSGQLELPHPPRAPATPSIPVDSKRPTQSSWQSYLVAFKAYMVGWNIFNEKMISHFVARKHQVDKMAPGWLEAFGESGYEKYMEGLREDEKIREWWDVACGKHHTAMTEFKWMRDVVKEGVDKAPPNPSTMAR